MPLEPGSSKQVIRKNIAEFHHGGTYERTALKHGKKTADAQAVAAAYSNARKSTHKKKEK